MSYNLQLARPRSRLSLVLEDQASEGADRWAEAGSPTDAAPHKPGFLPTSGRLLKCDSEDSGVASNNHSPLTPVEGERFSLDAVDEDGAPAPWVDCPTEEDSEELAYILDCAHWQELCVERQLSGMTQRSVSVDRGLDAVSGGDIQATSDCSTIEEERIEEPQEPASPCMPGPGLHYLENLCQLMENVAELQKANLHLRHEHQVLKCRVQALESQVRTLKKEKKQFCDELTDDPEPLQSDPQLGDPAAMETEKEEDKNPNLLDSWDPRSFRARSVSDTHMLRRQTGSVGSKIDHSRKTRVNSASSPSLVDQLDSSSHTWPSGLKLPKNDPSRWRRVKGFFNRIARRSTQTKEVAPSSDTNTSCRRYRAGSELVNKEVSCSRRRFLPNLMAKRHRSKHVSMG